MTASDIHRLGAFLKDRRSKLDPAAFGLPMTRRRTPGLRREEVAQRANVSATWYTWLEQGRGGGPSADVLDRIARALMLTDVEREHLFLLGLGHPPEIRHEPTSGVSPRLQRVLDALEFSPAYIKTSAWDIVAWNRAATVVLTDYGDLPPDQRNLLRLVFRNERVRAAQPNWEVVARFVVAAFRADTVRAGISADVGPLIEELSIVSPEFALMWRDNDVKSAFGEIAKELIHPVVGPLKLEYSTFPVDGRQDLSLVIYNPATAEDIDKIRFLLSQPCVQQAAE